MCLIAVVLGLIMTAAGIKMVDASEDVDSRALAGVGECVLVLGVVLLLSMAGIWAWSVWVGEPGLALRCAVNHWSLTNYCSFLDPK